jgi:hypothetical protein
VGSKYTDGGSTHTGGGSTYTGRGSTYTGGSSTYSGGGSTYTGAQSMSRSDLTWYSFSCFEMVEIIPLWKVYLIMCCLQGMNGTVKELWMITSRPVAVINQHVSRLLLFTKTFREILIFVKKVLEDLR